MKHRKLKHDKNNRVSYHCTKQGCEKIFKTKDSHRRHMKTSSHLKPWKDLSRYQKAKRLKKEQAGQTTQWKALKITLHDVSWIDIITALQWKNGVFLH